MAFRVQIAGTEALSEHQFVTDVEIKRSLYTHSRARVTMGWSEFALYGAGQAAHVAAQVLHCPIDIEWKGDDLAETVRCFHGYIEQVSGRREGGSSYIILDCVSFSLRTDLVPRYRVFQDTTLLAIAKQLLKIEPLIKIVTEDDLNIPIALSLQYAETDFVYISRMMHAWGIPMMIQDMTGEVLLGARGIAASTPFPDVDFRWRQVNFSGALDPLVQQGEGEEGGGGPTGVVRGQVGRFYGPLDRKTADYHQIPDHQPIRENIGNKAAQVDVSSYHLVLDSSVLPFSPGDVVSFEGQDHLLRHVRIEGHNAEAKATQEFWLQPLTLPLQHERTTPAWPSQAVWAYVRDNEHDPLQQGRLQVEFEWEALDPQPSGVRAWLHTLTPYGGGNPADKKSSAYSGLYSLPEPGERVLVEFLGQWDSEAVIVGAVRHDSQKSTLNAKHTKRWSTPNGNEVTMTSRGNDEVVRMRNKGQLVFEAHTDQSGHHVSILSGGSEADKIHISVNKDGTRVEILGSNDMLISAGARLHLEAKQITLHASGAEGIKFESAVGDISLNAITGKVAAQAKSKINLKALAGKVGVEGQSGVDVNAPGGPTRVDGQPYVHLESGEIPAIDGVPPLPM